MNRQTNLIVLLAACAAASGSQAAEFQDYAKVLRVTPQVEQVNLPRQQCWYEHAPVQQHQQRGIGGAIIGGLAGGVIGNQIGGGSGRTAATAVGAVAGAIVGDRMENQHQQPVYRQQIQRCQMVDHWETRTNGYAVTYEYRGYTDTTIMPYEPGNRIPVQVSITPRI